MSTVSINAVDYRQALRDIFGLEAMSRMRPQVSFSRRYLWVIVPGIAAVCAALLLLVRLPVPVSAAEVVGTYVASYPFGTDTVTLNQNGTYIQRVEVAGDPPPAMAKGRWTFNSDSYNESYVTFYDSLLQVDDGFGRLKGDWRKEHPNSVSVPPVARVGFRILLNPEAKYPYVKQ